MKYLHTSIFVSNLQKSVSFYEEIVGLHVVEKLNAGNSNQIVFMMNEDAGTKIELIFNQREAFSGEGISLGFQVPDAKAYREKLEIEGYHPSPMVSPHPGVLFFFIKDPDGVTIQFMEE